MSRSQKRRTIPHSTSSTYARRTKTFFSAVYKTFMLPLSSVHLLVEREILLYNHNMKGVNRMGSYDNDDMLLMLDDDLFFLDDEGEESDV